MLRARAALIPASTTPLLRTGRTPGKDQSITLVLAFWSFPKWAEVGEKIFELVLSSTWTSSPMTVSKFISCHLQKSRVVVCGSLLLPQKQQQLGKWFPQST